MSTPTTPALLTQWFIRVWNERDGAAIDELMEPDVQSHGLVETIVGTRPWREKFYDPMWQTFSEVHMIVEDEIVAGDKVFARLSCDLTPRVTGKPVRIRGCCVVRVKNGRIAEAWDTWDFLTLLEGMELLPANSFVLALTGKMPPFPPQA